MFLYQLLGKPLQICSSPLCLSFKTILGKSFSYVYRSTDRDNWEFFYCLFIIWFNAVLRNVLRKRLAESQLYIILGLIITLVCHTVSVFPPREASGETAKTQFKGKKGNVYSEIKYAHISVIVVFNPLSHWCLDTQVKFIIVRICWLNLQ